MAAQFFQQINPAQEHELGEFLLEFEAGRGDERAGQAQAEPGLEGFVPVFLGEMAGEAQKFLVHPAKALAGPLLEDRQAQVAHQKHAHVLHVIGFIGPMQVYVVNSLGLGVVDQIVGVEVAMDEDREGGAQVFLDGRAGL